MTAAGSPRRVLVVAYDFPPHAAIGTMRTLRVVQRLAAEAWDITVLTGNPRTYRPGTPVDVSLLGRVPEDVRVLRAKTVRGFDRLKNLVKGPRPQVQVHTPPPSSVAAQYRRSHPSVAARCVDVVDAALAIPDHESGWLVPAIVKGMAECRRWRPDVIYSSAPPWTGQLVAGTLATLLNAPWVADFRDPWARAPWREDRFTFAKRAAARAERSVVNRADHIVFVARGNRDDFAGWYGPKLASKFHVVPNACDPSEFDRLDQPEQRATEPLVLLHAGSLYAGRTPTPLLNAIASAVRQGVISRDRFRLRFLGSIALQSSDLFSACQLLGIADMVEFLPRVPREKSLLAMRSAGALLLLQPGHTVSVPGKLYEYFAAGRPILAIAEEGETADLVRQSGIGISVPPANEDAIVDALRMLLPMSMRTFSVNRELFDGSLRAAQTTAILAAVANGEPVPSATVHSAFLSEFEHEVTRP